MAAGHRLGGGRRRCRPGPRWWPAPPTPARSPPCWPLCHEARVPVTPAGGRSGVCGASVPLFGGVALDLCGLAGIGDGRRRRRSWPTSGPAPSAPTSSPGSGSGHGVTLGHWPQSMDLSTVGGWLACRGAGQYSNRYGKIEDMVIGLEVVLADGRVVRTGGHGPRSATGPDLTQLFVGSEGTLGVITEGRFRVHPVPAGEDRRAFGFTSFADGPRRLPPHPPPRRHPGRAPPLRRHRVGAELRAARHQRPDRPRRGRPRPRRGHPGRRRRGVRAGGRPARRRPGRPLAGAPQRRVGPGAPVARRHRGGHGRGRRPGGRRCPGSTDAVLGALAAIEGTLAASAHQSHAYTDGACLYFTFAGRPPEDLVPTAPVRPTSAGSTGTTARPGTR